MPECDEVGDSDFNFDVEFADLHRAEYLSHIKEAIMHMNPSTDLEVPDRANMSESDIFKLCVQSQAQKKKRREAEKELEKSAHKTSASKIAASARNIFTLLYPDRLISLSHSDGLAII